MRKVVHRARKLPLLQSMNHPRRRVVLFLLCAVVLLGAGFAWGYANAYDHFYSPDATLDRELSRLDLNSRMLHYVNAGKPAECRRVLVTQLREQIPFVRGMVKVASPEAQADANEKLKQAELAINGQPSGTGTVAGAATAGR